MNPLTEQLTDTIRKADLIQGKFITESLSRLSEMESGEFERYLEFCLANGASVASLAEAYLGMVDDIMGEQLFFAQTGRYRYSRLDEVESHVYADPEYMGKYIRGIALSLYLWPQHQEIKRFFQQVIPKDVKGDYLEVGPGHGMFFLQALRNGNFSKYYGMDISPTSIATTRALLETYTSGCSNDYELILGDFLSTEPPAEVAACVAGEVLEHVEHPELFLERFHQATIPGGFVFISTCINAPVVDHIYNFETIEALEKIIASAGLTIEEKMLVPHAGLTLDRCVRKRLPISMAYALRNT